MTSMLTSGSSAFAGRTLNDVLAPPSLSCVGRPPSEGLNLLSKSAQEWQQVPAWRDAQGGGVRTSRKLADETGAPAHHPSGLEFCAGVLEKKHLNRVSNGVVFLFIRYSNSRRWPDLWSTRAKGDGTWPPSFSHRCQHEKEEQSLLMATRAPDGPCLPECRILAHTHHYVRPPPVTESPGFHLPH
ncbi:hypothetical protein LX36DRAFT_101732 [Colletotrichum falcatum]|nr:hypothetical protein LX36DRAFT_101732 [Colletotrichum falcatum]